MVDHQRTICPEAQGPKRDWHALGGIGAAAGTTARGVGWAGRRMTEFGRARHKSDAETPAIEEDPGR